MCCRTMVVQSYRGNLEKRRRVRTVKCVALYFVFCVSAYFVLYFTVCVVWCDSSYYVLY